MRQLRFSLFSKIMLWFFLNLLLLAAVLWLTTSFGFDSRSRFFGLSNRIEAVTRQIESEINQQTREKRDEILKSYSENYRVEFFLFDSRGKQLAGREIVLPPEVSRNVAQSETLGGNRGNRRLNAEPNLPPPRNNLTPPMPGNFSPPAPPSAYFRAGEPALFWFVGRIMTAEPDEREPVRARVVVASDSFTGRGLFFDPTPYLVVAFGITGLSILFWLPFVRRITGAIGQMTSAAESIANENFAVRVNDKRTDEIGRLGKSINHLAERLTGFVTGQKRFLGDISHELNSPLARMQFALTILEDRVDQKNLAYVQDVREEAELMSKLVGELLTFSKAGIKTAAVKLDQVYLRPLVETAAQRETAHERAEIILEINEDLQVLANAELLERAVANVIRNAVRYAGNTGAITVKAEPQADKIRLTIAYQGAGVADSELEKLFDPFYRLESDRARATGGSGLGLAIVKSCVEVCGGRVFAENLKPNGFQVTMLLQKD